MNHRGGEQYIYIFHAIITTVRMSRRTLFELYQVKIVQFRILLPVSPIRFHVRLCRKDFKGPRGRGWATGRWGNSVHGPFSFDVHYSCQYNGSAPQEMRISCIVEILLPSTVRNNLSVKEGDERRVIFISVCQPII